MFKYKTILYYPGISPIVSRGFDNSFDAIDWGRKEIDKNSELFGYVVYDEDGDVIHFGTQKKGN